MPEPEEPILISYPGSAAAIGNLRRRKVASGTYIVDFKRGIVIFPDATEELMSGSLKRFGLKFIRSLMIYFQPFNAAFRFTETSPYPQIFSDQCAGYHFYDNIKIKERFEIQLTSGLTPDEFDLQILASNMPHLPYRFVPQIIHFHTNRTALVPTNSNVAYLLQHPISYRALTIKVFNTGSNSIDVTIQTREVSDGTWRTESGYPASIAAAGTNLFRADNLSIHFIQVLVKNTTADEANTFDLEFSARS